MKSQACSTPVLLAFVAFVGLASREAAGAETRTAFPSGSLPVDIVENRGQWNGAARFVARSGGVAAFFEDHAIVLRALRETAAVRLAFEGAEANARPAGAGARGGVYNFYFGSDSSRWRTGVPGYRRIVYQGLYPGIDLVVDQEGGRLEYDLMLVPGVDLDQVAVRGEGVTGLEVTAEGALVMQTKGVSLRQTPPRTWEVLPSGERRPLASRFRLLGANRYGFEAPGRDRRLALVVDPGLEWSTFLGGSGADFIGPAAPARDGSGDVFVGGTMASVDFPSFDDPSFAPPIQTKAFVARLDASGSHLVYATFLGGWHAQLVTRGLAVDAGGNAVLCGQTFSPDFPTTPGAVDRIAEYKEGFVFRLNPAGGLIFSTFLGGVSEDIANAVAYDPSGNIIVGGTTSSPDFPTTPGAFDRTYNVPNAPADGGADGDMFVTKLSPDGGQILYSTYIGGPSADVLEDLVVDPSGIVTVAGWVTGNNVKVFVTTPGAFDATWNGGQDAALARLKLDGAGAADLKYATFIGGASDDDFWSVALDPTNPELVTLAGHSWSSDYPTTAGVVRPTNPPFSDLFPNVEAGIITRFRFPAAGGGTLVWSTYHHAARITSVTVNAAGEPIVVGDEAPWGIFTTRGAFDRTAAGVGAPAGAFVSRLDANATQYLYQSFFGGGGEADNFRTTPQVKWISGNTVIISGQTSSPDFLTTPLALDTTFGNPEGGGANDGFVMKLALDADASGDLTADPPTQVTPADGITYHNGSVLRLQWNGVTDPSGVEAYEFQMSNRADFADGFIIYRGALAGTEAILPPSGTGETGLGQITWYWRVRTSDRAGNLSAWSPTRSFTISQSSGAPTVSVVGVHPPSSYSSGPTGGSQATGVILLYDPAPQGGLVARLSAHWDRTVGLDKTRTLPVPVSVPATVTIPQGALSAAFPIATSAVSQLGRVTILATIDGLGNQTTITVMPAEGPKPTAVSFTPGMLTGGRPTTGTVTISAPAPAGGTVVSLSTSHPAVASVPASVTVPAAATSASFPVTTSAVSVEVDVQITARSAGEQWMAALYVRPPGLPTLTGMTISPASVAGGASSGGTLTFSGPLPLGRWPAYQDGLVSFSSSDPEVAAIFPGDQFLPAGSASYTFRIYTRGVPAARSVTISASYDGVTLSRVLTVGAVSSTVSSITANVTNLKGGEGGVATVNLSAPTATTLLLTVSTSHPGLFSSLPATVTVSGGATSTMFGFVANKTATATTSVTVTAAYGASARSLALTIGPPTEATPALVSVTLNPASVAGGGASTGTATLQSAARAGGAVVQLSSDDVSVASVPASVTVPAGSTSATFPVTTSTVPSTRTVPIWGLLNLTAGAALTVTSAAPAPTLASLTLNPTSVTGGASSIGTATLSAAAPAGGQAVSLSSSNPAVASVPASVTVAGGATSATFTVTTSAVSSSTVVTLTGASGGATRTAGLTVGPSGGGVPPGFMSPTANAPDSGGDGNGFETSPSSAQVLDGVQASDNNSGTGTGTSCTSTGKDRHRFYNYGFSIPGGASITGLEVRLDARADSTSGSPKMCVQLSWDGGTSWTAAKATGTLGTSLASFTLGGSTDNWGRTWSAGDLANASFRLRVIDVSSSTSRDFFLDWVGVRVTTATGGPATLSAVSLNPATVAGGNPSTGTVTLTAAAPTGGAVVSLASGNTAVATVPASVTVAAGATSASFTVTTVAVAANTNVTVSGTYSATTQNAVLTVTPPAALSVLTLGPTSVTGGSPSTGTVILTSGAPAGGAVVSLASSNTAVATTPASVTVPAGATSTTFTVTTQAVSSASSATISGTYAGVTRSATLTVNPQASDTVAIQTADYSTRNAEITVGATSTSAAATLTVYVTSTNQLIGTLQNDGGGNYSGRFSWPTNPQNITVRSSGGGSATRAVSSGR